VTAARGAAPRRGRRFAGSRRFRPSERRFAWRAHARSGRASRFPRSWRERFPTRPPSLDRSSPSSARVRGPKQIAALSRHRSRAPVSHRVHSEDGAIASPDTNARRLEGVGARRAGILSLRAVVAVNDPYAGDRGAVRRQGHFFTLSHRCRLPGRWDATRYREQYSDPTGSRLRGADSSGDRDIETLTPMKCVACRKDEPTVTGRRHPFHVVGAYRQHYDIACPESQADKTCGRT